MPDPELSVVSTLYRSAPFLAEFITRATAAAEALGGTFEIVLVDDGSPDESLVMAIEAAGRDPRLRVVELSRNFGHHAAILAGLSMARGRRVFLVDSDLEEPPELLLRFAQVMAETEADVVYGVHDQVVGNRVRRVTSGLFWKAFNTLSDTQTAENICHVRLMQRDYLDVLVSLRERGVFLGGLYAWPGYRQVPIRVERVINRTISTYGLSQRAALAIRSLVSFSARPLHFLFFLGTGIALLSALVAGAFLVLRLFGRHELLTGFASLIISIWFLGGLTIMSLGVIGLYVSQVYAEVKDRPRAVIRRIHAADANRATAT